MNKFATLLFATAALAGLGGCQSPAPAAATYGGEQAEIKLREGDTVRITFPASPTLDSPSQIIRRDGKITLATVGEVKVTGLTPTELQDKLLSLYAGQILSKEILVTVLASSFSVYIDGPVGRPGKITTDRPLSLLEAVMEAGGFDYEKADTKHIQILRHEGDGKSYTYFTVNLDDVLKGKRKDLFYLAPGDIVHVLKKFSVF